MSSNYVSNKQDSSKRIAPIMNTTITSVIQDDASKKMKTPINNDIQRKGIFSDTENDFFETSEKLKASFTRIAVKNTSEEFNDDDLYVFMDEDYQDDQRLSDTKIFDDIAKSSMSNP